MALTIPVPSSAYSNQEITLAGRKYNFKFSYNGRDTRWRLSILLGDTIVISSVKMMENQRLLQRFRLPDFQHGDLFCIRIQDDGQEVGRSNFGIGKAYELLYLTTAEIAAL